MKLSLWKAYLLLPLLAFGQTVCAADYYWKFSNHDDRFDSAVSACQWGVQLKQSVDTGGYTYTYESTVIRQNGLTYLASCYYAEQVPSGQVFPNQELRTPVSTVQRYGDTCRSGSTYDPSTGECVPEPNRCEATIGQTIPHEHKMKDAVGQPTIDPPDSVCANSCQYSFGYTPATNVYVYKSGTPPGVFGVYTYTGNGIQCDADTRVELGDPTQQTNPDETPTPDPENNCPAGYVWNGTFCSPEQPTDPEEPTDPEDPTDPVEPGEGDGDGDDGGDPGTGGGGDGEGDGNGDGGNGDGNGEGQCDPATDPNQCKDSSVGGEGCDAELSCSGDAVQCAILKQQKALRCHAEEQTDFESHKSDIEGMLEGEKFTLDEGDSVIEVPSFINQGVRFLPEACPADETFTLRTSGGRTFALSYEPLCRAASDLSGLFVAVAAILAALYVGRSVGGN